MENIQRVGDGGRSSAVVKKIFNVVKDKRYMLDTDSVNLL